MGGGEHGQAAAARIRLPNTLQSGDNPRPGLEVKTMRSCPINILIACLVVSPLACTRQEEQKPAVSADENLVIHPRLGPLPPRSKRAIISQHVSATSQKGQNPERTKIDDRDMEVLNVILDDLLTYPDSPHVDRSPPNEIPLSPLADESPQNARFVFEQILKHSGKPLNKRQRHALEEGLQNVVARTSDGLAFDRDKLKDSRIHIYDEDALSRPPVQPQIMHPRLVSAWPPGYSRDKKFAVLRLFVPWGYHHTDATYLLSEHQGKWTVIFRDFMDYF